MNLVAAKWHRDSRVRRWCARALVAVGAAAAGTAAAWILSSATASAATAQDSDERSPSVSVGSLQQLRGDTRNALLAGAERLEEALRPQSSDDADANEAEESAKADESTDLEQAVQDVSADWDARTSDEAQAWRQAARERMRSTYEDTVTLIEHLLTGQYEPPAYEENPEFAEWRERIKQWFVPAEDIVVGVAPAADGVVGEAVPESESAKGAAAPVHGAHSERMPAAAESEWAAAAADLTEFLNDRGVSPSASVDTLDLPSSGFGFRSPAGAPAVPSSHSSGNAGSWHVDGTPFGITAGSGRAMDAATADMALSGARTAPFQPGRQPGVTPD